MPVWAAEVRRLVGQPVSDIDGDDALIGDPVAHVVVDFAIHASIASGGAPDGSTAEPAFTMTRSRRP
ncbi:hypothetical protein BCh11DRAFT_01328 [Burkholderia sp. Ch1-1]|nr:hypothetical protein BCh11DRAFT_01328 [Burkholderia sp. Ch1-1]